MGYYECEGLVLSRRDVFETDQLIHLLTPDLGGIEARAPNARKSQKVYCARLEPPNIIKTRLYKSRDNSRWTVSELEIVEPFAELLRKNSLRYYLWPLLSLYRDLFPEGEQPGSCYDRFIYGLQFLRAESVDPLLVIDRILVKTAEEIGVALDVTQCLSCSSRESRMWRLHPVRGLFCERCFDSVDEKLLLQLSSSVRELFLLLEKLPWQEVIEHDFDPKTLANLESLMYRFFHYHFEISLQALNVRKNL